MQSTQPHTTARQQDKSTFTHCNVALQLRQITGSSIFVYSQVSPDTPECTVHCTGKWSGLRQQQWQKGCRWWGATWPAPACAQRLSAALGPALGTGSPHLACIALLRYIAALYWQRHIGNITLPHLIGCVTRQSQCPAAICETLCMAFRPGLVLLQHYELHMPFCAATAVRVQQLLCWHNHICAVWQLYA